MVAQGVEAASFLVPVIHSAVCKISAKRGYSLMHTVSQAAYEPGTGRQTVLDDRAFLDHEEGGCLRFNMHAILLQFPTHTSTP